ncbi:hypothetical protein [Streptomyces sp. NPDC056160]|uniref:hypothetical protein n=1 Tax=Streptomyces sp. NPDC056160 TaxID=3345731 RepID=UPI0035E317F9
MSGRPAGAGARDAAGERARAGEAPRWEGGRIGDAVRGPALSQEPDRPAAAQPCPSTLVAPARRAGGRGGRP